MAEPSDKPTSKDQWLPGADASAANRPLSKWEEFRELKGTALLGIAWAGFPFVLGLTLVGFLPTAADYLNKLGPWALLAYVGLFTLSAGIGFLPTFGQAFLGGWAFGFVLGFPCAMIGFVGGSAIGYAIAKTVSGQHVERAIAANARARAVRAALVGQGFWRTLGIVTLVRVPPNMPFSLTNLLMASSGVRFLPYLLGTAIGMAPRTALAVWFAHEAHLKNPDAKNFVDIIKQTPWWYTLSGVVLLVVALSVIAYIGNRALDAAVGDGSEPDQPKP